MPPTATDEKSFVFPESGECLLSTKNALPEEAEAHSVSLSGKHGLSPAGEHGIHNRKRRLESSVESQGSANWFPKSRAVNCLVHGEPAVLRTVKKQGSNFGRRFSLVFLENMYDCYFALSNRLRQSAIYNAKVECCAVALLSRLSIR